MISFVCELKIDCRFTSLTKNRKQITVTAVCVFPFKSHLVLQNILVTGLFGDTTDSSVVMLEISKQDTTSSFPVWSTFSYVRQVNSVLRLLHSHINSVMCVVRHHFAIRLQTIHGGTVSFVHFLDDIKSVFSTLCSSLGYI